MSKKYFRDENSKKKNMNFFFTCILFLCSFIKSVYAAFYVYYLFGCISPGAGRCSALISLVQIAYEHACVPDVPLSLSFVNENRNLTCIPAVLSLPIVPSIISYNNMAVYVLLYSVISYSPCSLFRSVSFYPWLSRSSVSIALLIIPYSIYSYICSLVKKKYI